MSAAEHDGASSAGGCGEGVAPTGPDQADTEVLEGEVLSDEENEEVARRFAETARSSVGSLGKLPAARSR